MQHRDWSLTLASILAVSLAGCGGSVGVDPGAHANDAGADGSRTEPGEPSTIVPKPRPAACPSVGPSSNDACAPAGLECEYTAEDARCGTYTCSNDGRWWRSPAAGCAPPPGIACPVPSAPYVGGPSATLDKSCDARDDCVLVTLQTDCCGNTLSYAVNKSSAQAAETYAATCRRTFPGCGCLAGPTVAEVGPPLDGGPTTIVAVCSGPNGCISQYVSTR